MDERLKGRADGNGRQIKNENNELIAEELVFLRHCKRKSRELT